MANKTTLAAGTSPFAHLLGGAAALAGRALGKKADDEKPDPDAEGDEDEANAEGEDGDEPEKGKRGKKAEGDEPDPDAEEEGDDADAEDEDKEEPEGRKAQSAYQQGFAAANKRASAIFLSPAAAGRPDLAAQLAFGTSMSAKEAIGVLATANASQPRARGRLDDRMAGRAEVRPGAGGGAPGKASFADRMASAKKKAGL